MNCLSPILRATFATIVLIFLFLTPTTNATTAQQTTLYAFSGNGSDTTPISTLAVDATGNFYGVTPGEVYEVSPPSLPGGVWNETIIHTFTGGSDGRNAAGALVLDSLGNLYGTTQSGGSGQGCSGGCGVVFELSPPSVIGGAWTEMILYNFQGASGDGAIPYAGVVLDKVGNLYGTTTLGGRGNCPVEGKNEGCGTIFQLSPPSAPGDPWTETLIASFFGGSDGSLPYAGLTSDANGNFYGATEYGGGGCPNGYYYPGCGTVFSITRKPDGTWAKHVIFRFINSATAGPFAGVTLHDGAIYGTTLSSVYEISMMNGTTVLTDLYNVTDDCAFAYSAVVFDHAGNIYGTTSDQGCTPYIDEGYVYELQPPQVRGGAWTESILSYDGDPYGGLIIYKDALYGTDMLGGNYTEICDDYLGCGTVYSITP